MSGWGEAPLVLECAGRRYELGLLDLGVEGVRVRHDGVEHPCAVATHHDGSVWVNDPSGQTSWCPLPRLPEAGEAGTAVGPISELPGTVVAVLVEVGQSVTAGQQLVVVEAMKMEHPAVAATDGLVEEIHVAVGQYVEAKTVLVSLTSNEEMS